MNEQEKNLVNWLADMNEDDAFGTNAIDAVSLCKNWMGVAA